MTKKLPFFGVVSVTAASLCLLTGCGWLATSGPSETQVTWQNNSNAKPSIAVIDMNDSVARRVLDVQKHSSFSEVFTEKTSPELVVGAGDTLAITVWEAPPAMLFATSEPRSGVPANQTTTLPDQMVAEDGTITIPFAGIIKVGGKSPRQIGNDIAKRLTGLANRPQVLVRVAHNVTSNVTVVGEVGQSQRMALTAQGEHLLDALAAAGGVRQPVDKMTLQVSRNGKVLSMAMDDVIRDPQQNITLHAGDVVTAIHQPLSFTILGATGKNAEINFESKGITLAQALGRIGGMDDNRANAGGVFIFRFEDPAAVDLKGKAPPQQTPEGKLPVVYRIDLRDPRTFLIAQNFPVLNKDVIYVANAPLAEFQKFMNIIYSVVFSAVNVRGL